MSADKPSESTEMLSPEEVQQRVKALRDEKRVAESPKHLEGRGVAGRMITDFASGVAVGVGIGYWLDSQFETSPLWLVVFMIFGMLGGFLNMYRTYERASNQQ